MERLLYKLIILSPNNIYIYIMRSFRKRIYSKKNNKSRKYSKKQNNKRRKLTKKNIKHNKRRIIKGGNWFSTDKLKNLRDNYNPLMKLFNKVLDAKYEDTECDVGMGGCEYFYWFHKKDYPEIKRLSELFNDLYTWTVTNKGLILTNDQLNKARKMKDDIDANLNSKAYIALITEDEKNAKLGYPKYDANYR